MTIHYTDDQVTLHDGHDVDVLRDLPDGSVNCCVTSPPYYGLRDYGMDGQRGNEATPSEYVAGMVEVFREVRRVLADDGTLWLNLGDSYSSTGGTKGVGPNASVGSTLRQATGRTRPRSTLPTKNLLGIPWQVAFALQDDDWTLRNAIVWYKPNAMPESVTDRLAGCYEYVFLLTKGPHYWFDLAPIRVPHITGDRPIVSRDVSQRPGSWAYGSGGRHRSSGPEGVGRNELGRNPGDVWPITTKPFPGAHYAVMALDLAERCVMAGCRPGGTVLDPYSGSGTTGLAAIKHGRRYVGIDLDPANHDLALRTRLHQGALIADVVEP